MYALGVLFEDSFGSPPDPQDAADYNAAVDAFEFVSDYFQQTIPFFPGGGLPRILVIDTTTMEIVYKASHYDEAAILAAANGI
jgi:hypothetical protein